MNKLFSALILVLVAFSWVSCHKEMDVKDPVVSKEEMAVSGAQACFSWCVDFTEPFQTGVELSPNENMTELRRVEATKEGNKYVAVVDGLLMGTNYYYRIVVWNKLNNYEQEMKSFATSPTFTITLACNPEEGGTATGGGTYIVGDSCIVVATANVGYNFVNWTENGNQVSTDSEFCFTVTEDRYLVANFTSQEYTITAIAGPEEGGTVIGSGGYNHGDECTLTAIANEGYSFVNWTKDGTEVSVDSAYTFAVTETAVYVAHFQLLYTITVSAAPANGGSVEGGGSFNYGQNCTITATASNNYNFSHWTDDGDVVSMEASYTFTVTGNRSLVAHFVVVLSWPNGVLPGHFSVSDTQQVQFSQGNLQYIGSASTPYWKFADNQWNCLGDGGQGSTSQTVDRDLFGWGTSGWDCGNTYYRPWDSDADAYTISNLYGPPGQYDLTGSYAYSDWGVYNPISNGGDQAGLWRTLTGDEWRYVLFTRCASIVNGTPDARYAKAKVNNVQGMILFPDNYTHPSEVVQPVGINDGGDTGWNGNSYSAADFKSMEQNGAVFLPAAGGRGGTLVCFVDSYGTYWSASHGISLHEALGVQFFGTGLSAYNGYTRDYGSSVRLVRVAEN